MYVPKSAHRRMRLLGGVVLAALGLLVTACGSGGGTSSAVGGWAKSPVDFVYAGLSPTYIDPALADDLDSFTVTRNLYDPLVWTDNAGHVIPWLATSWKASANGLSTTFTLRHGVKFSDGSTFTSADVKTTIDREIALKAGDSGEVLTSVTSVSTPSAYTAVINTSAPDPYLLAHLTRVGIISTAGVKAHRTASDPWATNWYENHSDGTGPYVLSSWQKGAQLTLTKNKNWWHGWQPGSIDVVVDKFVPAYASRVEMVQSGAAGLTETWTVTDAERVGKAKGFTLQTYSTYDIDPLITLNTQKPPFNNVLVRRAAQLAFNYKAMVSYWDGEATVPGGPMPNNFPGAVQFPSYQQDLSQAKSLIKKSGVNLAKTPVTITTVAGVPEFGVEATIFQQSLAQAGFKVSIQTLPGAQALATLGKPQQGANALTLISSPFTADPTLFLGNFYLPTGAFNFSYYSNPKVTALLNSARTSPSASAATSDTQQAEKMIQSDAPAIWPTVPKTLVPVPDYIVGYHLAITDFRWSTYFWPLRIKAH